MTSRLWGELQHVRLLRLRTYSAAKTPAPFEVGLGVFAMFIFLGFLDIFWNFFLGFWII